MLDTGSRQNVIGLNTVAKFAVKAEEHGHKITTEALEHPYVAGGIGKGPAHQ